MVLLIKVTKNAQGGGWSFTCAELWGLLHSARLDITDDDLKIDAWSQPTSSKKVDTEFENQLDQRFGEKREAWMRYPGFPTVERPEFIATLAEDYCAAQLQSLSTNPEERRNARSFLEKLEYRPSKQDGLPSGIVLQSDPDADNGQSLPPDRAYWPAQDAEDGKEQEEDDGEKDFDSKKANKMHKGDDRIVLKYQEEASRRAVYRWFFRKPTPGGKVHAVTASLVCLGKVTNKVIISPRTV